MTSTGDGGGKVLDEIDLLPLLQLREQLVDERRNPRLQGAQRVGAQPTDDLAPHARMVGRIVEYQTPRVMFVERRVGTEFGAKHHLLVGAEVSPVAVNLVEIRKAAEKVTPIRTAMHRFKIAQRRVDLVRILVKAGVQSVWIERSGDGAGLFVVHRRSDACSQLLEQRDHGRRILDVGVVAYAGNLAGLRGVRP